MMRRQLRATIGEVDDAIRDGVRKEAPKILAAALEDVEKRVVRRFKQEAGSLSERIETVAGEAEARGRSGAAQVTRDAVQKICDADEQRISSITTIIRALQTKYHQVTKHEEQLQKEVLEISSKLKDLQVKHQKSSLDVDQRYNFLSNSLENANRTLSMKVGVKEICDLLDQKADLDEVNRALKSMFSVLRSNNTGDGTVSHLPDDTPLFSSFESHNPKGVSNPVLEDCEIPRVQKPGVSPFMHAIGRWLWKGDYGKSNQLFWSVEVVNSHPEHVFGWNPKKPAVLTVKQPGLYELQLSLFMDRQSSIKVLVNGSPALLALNSTSYVLHHSAGKVTQNPHHPEGNVSGYSVIDFLALPQNARISVILDSPYDGSREGFLGFRKL
eukprot:Rmarinus@m.18208